MLKLVLVLANGEDFGPAPRKEGEHILQQHSSGAYFIWSAKYMRWNRLPEQLSETARTWIGNTDSTPLPFALMKMRY